MHTCRHARRYNNPFLCRCTRKSVNVFTSLFFIYTPFFEAEEVRGRKGGDIYFLFSGRLEVMRSYANQRYVRKRQVICTARRGKNPHSRERQMLCTFLHIRGKYLSDNLTCQKEKKKKKKKKF
ncbi:hypothetical protein POVWA1_009170 [Plasmodium ovale wallikeri]|uniref:Uncharacterized protein n=1 Tax=Plasmodium ovale wallikeri TaxID=864142 RepID=A0A1A8YJX4_PLAOA|nr:hypothetical protein POVWA1_009170 [Plasmodium ovale wallikeri]